MISTFSSQMGVIRTPSLLSAVSDRLAFALVGYERLLHEEWGGVGGVSGSEWGGGQ